MRESYRRISDAPTRLRNVQYTRSQRALSETLRAPPPVNTAAGNIMMRLRIPLYQRSKGQNARKISGRPGVFGAAVRIVPTLALYRRSWEAGYPILIMYYVKPRYLRGEPGAMRNYNAPCTDYIMRDLAIISRPSSQSAEKSGERMTPWAI